MLDVVARSNSDVGDALASFGHTLASVVPKAILFVVILIVGWLIAAALRKLTHILLDRIHFDRLVERGGVHRVLARSGTDAASIVAKLVYYLVLLFTLEFAFGI